MNAYARTGTLLAGAAIVIGLTAVAALAMAGDQSGILPALPTIPGTAMLLGAGLALNRARTAVQDAKAGDPMPGDARADPATAHAGQEPAKAHAEQRPAAARKPLGPLLRLLALASSAATILAAIALAFNEPVVRVLLITGLALQGSLCLWWASRSGL